MVNLTLKQALKGLESKDFCAKELLDAVFARIKGIKNNAFICLNEEDAYKRAALFDAGKLSGILAGIPVAVKDNIDVKGLRTTCASAALKDSEPALNNAFAVQKLLDAGAIIVGKTNMDEFAMGSSSTTSAFGAPLNPLGKNRVTGGSSGGSASAVAYDQCFAALGSDTGGSIRQPASYCSVTGLKPSLGAIGRTGCFPLAPSFDAIGPITRTVTDCALVFSALCGYDAADALSLKNSDDFFNPLANSLSNSPANSLSNPLAKPLKIGLIRNLDMWGEGEKAFDAAFTKLKQLGCQFIDLNVPSFSYARNVYSVCGYKEMHQSLSGIKNRDLLGLEVKKRVLLGRYFSQNSELLQKANALKSVLHAEMNAALSLCDVIMTPSAPSVAFLKSTPPDNPDVARSDFYTQPPAICGLPALSTPFYKNKGLAIGTQFISKSLGEPQVFAAGMLLRDEIWR